MTRIIASCLLIAALASQLCLAQNEVPEKYRAFYDQYKAGLEKYNAYLDKNAAAEKNTVCFGAELLAANSNRGEDLLYPRVLKGVELSLDRLVKLGIQGATVAIGYPMLTGEGVGGAASAAIYRVVSANMQAGTSSELGRYYSDLIQRSGTTPITIH